MLLPRCISFLSPVVTRPGAGTAPTRGSAGGRLPVAVLLPGELRLLRSKPGRCLRSSSRRRPSCLERRSTKDAPSIPVDQIIQKFAAREAEFKEERDNFTYVQDFVIQTITDSGHVDGEYEMTSDITFTPDGKRYEQITYAPQPTLERIMLSQQDLDDLRNVQPFVLTTAELPKYDVTYVGREKVDEIPTYVFDVGPKRLEKNQRYFQGRIWVDATDMEIVKTYGKAVSRHPQGRQ